jgi:uncharacterized protein (DUF885 family)
VSAGVHAICDSYVDDYARLNPLAATEFGITGHDSQMPDLSPDGHAARAGLARRALAAVQAAEPVDESENIAKLVFAERIGLAVAMHEAGLPAADLNLIASPAQQVRETFDLMPTGTVADWAVIATRLHQVPGALAGYAASLAASADRGVVAAVRQVRRVVKQCETWSDSFFDDFVALADAVPGTAGALHVDLAGGARAAATAYADLAAFLRDRLAPKATERDAVGAQRYRLWSRQFTGADIDPRDAYTWGWDEFARIEKELTDVAGRIKQDASPADAAESLDADPRYRVPSQAAFRDWMAELCERALADLRGSHFDIPAELMRLDCRIAPPGGGLGAYYTGPADDFSRPGTMWWSLPADKAEIATWREASTVYHEGVPGHHLQIGTAVATPGLNRFQRLLCFIDGHGEGWALYAERLMGEFGYLDDAYLLGMLNKSILRAARVIVDIGMHLELAIPAGTGFAEGATWTPALGVEFLRTRTLVDTARAVDEIDRYLGWPGQAASYKLGERQWLSLRADVQARRGSSFDLKDFHMRALRGGPAGLDTMRELLVTP